MKSTRNFFSLFYIFNLFCIVIRSLRSSLLISSFLENLGSLKVSSKTIVNAITRFGILVRWRRSRLTSSIADLPSSMQLNQVEADLVQCRRSWNVSASREDMEKDEKHFKDRGMWIDYQDLRELFTSSYKDMWETVCTSGDIRNMIALILLSMMCLTRPSARTQTYCDLTVGHIRQLQATRNSKIRQIEITDFKTAAKYKTLYLSIHSQTHSMIEKYLEVRKGPGDGEPLFISPGNCKCNGTDIHRYIHGFLWKVTGGRISLSVNSIRRSYRTAIEQSQRLTKLDKELVDSVDTHSTKVVNQHYNKTSRKEMSERADELYHKMFAE